MQFSQLEREMHNSPLKCTTNSEAASSPEKATGSAHKLQDHAYRNSGAKKAIGSPSPEKTTASRLANNSPSPNKQTENLARMEDRKIDSPPRKYHSPTRAGTSNKKSPSKSGGKPFGQPLEIIKSKSRFIRHMNWANFSRYQLADKGRVSRMNNIWGGYSLRISAREL